MSDNEQQKPGRKTATSAPAATHEYGAPADAAPADTNNAAPAAASAADANNAAPAGSGDGANAAGYADEQDLAEREVQYLITPRREALGTLGVGPFGAHAGPDMGRIYEALTAMNNVTVVRRIRPSAVAVLAAGVAPNDDILVVRTTAENRRFLSGLGPPGLIIERDYLLGHLADASPPHVLAAVGVKPVTVRMKNITLRFRVQDARGQPQANTQICLYTDVGGEALGVSDASGKAGITANVGCVAEIVAIYVKPFTGHWEKFAYRPRLRDDAVNHVTLQTLASYAQAGFVDPAPGARGFCGWGQKLMGLDQIAIERGTGRGVKVAIIDSGCDNTHPALSHVRIGRDYTRLDAEHMPDEHSWNIDSMSHGSHCAGIICGNGKDGHIRGFVPEAEIHILKLFPGGAFNNLVAALHYCIDNQIDVVNCSLGGDQTSETIAQVIDTARLAGVAVVVAAGNSSGAVQFPASVPGVLCVAAIGAQGEYPDDTYHAQTCAPGTAGAGGLFPASFSCSGPQVTFCAPGVAVISCVPGAGYASWDGTSMAAPAITGLLAMVLAHYPEFAGKPAVRNAARVDRLFQIVALAAAPVGMRPQQTGAGLPRVTSGPAEVAQPAPALGAGAQISHAQLEEIVRQAFLSSLGPLADGSRAPVR